ncbi:MAG: immunoglobulin domain-containing protein [Ruminococcus sp.]|uniref:immunoglobulin domain-containing protein n=1 Tax=Ruminococcus sp. TaxID=41978 RepID=UPI0025CDC679|nr:immunoglobulin domain-containing protein [Ruminococcus sp.]MCR5600513.1 immunoglobulin domain-containing protein [Ruminococcus sp.]
MKNVSKKLLCALSSAILLCGASAIPASAKPLQLPADAFSGNTIDLGTTEYTLNEDYFEITRSEKARIEVRTPMSHVAGRNFIAQSYQWYRNGSIINGATSSFYEASEEGRYSCEVTVKSILKSSFEGTSNNTAAKNADICQELIDALREKISWEL